MICHIYKEGFPNAAPDQENLIGAALSPLRSRTCNECNFTWVSP